MLAALIFLSTGCEPVAAPPDNGGFMANATAVTSVAPTAAIDLAAVVTITPTAPVLPTITSTLTSMDTPVPTSGWTPLPTSPALPDGPPVVFLYNDGYLSRTDIEGSAIEQITTPLERIPEEVWLGLSAYPSQVSPDGRWLIVYSSRGRWQLLDLYEGLIAKSGQGQPKLSPTWAPDSQRFAYLTNDQVCIYELSGQTISCSFTGEDLLGVSWSAAGSYIAVAGANLEAPCCTGQVWLIDALTGEAELVGAYDAPSEGTTENLFTWSASGSALMIKSTSENVPSILFSPEEQIAISFNKPVFAISPDGRYLLYRTAEVGRVDGAILYSLPQDNECEGRQLSIHNWAWSPDGERLAYVVLCDMGKQAQQVSRLYMIAADTGEILWEQETNISLQLVYWSPDGTYLLLDELEETYLSPQSFHLSGGWQPTAQVQ